MLDLAKKRAEPANLPFFGSFSPVV